MAEAIVDFSRQLGFPSNSNSCVRSYEPLGTRTPSKNSRRPDPLPSRIKSLRACCVAICSCKLTCSCLQDYSEGWSKSSRLAPIQGTLYLHSSFGLLSPSAVAQVARIRLRANTFLNSTLQKSRFSVYDTIGKGGPGLPCSR